jgi:hypothetical protein
MEMCFERAELCLRRYRGNTGVQETVCEQASDTLWVRRMPTQIARPCAHELHTRHFSRLRTSDFPSVPSWGLRGESAPSGSRGGRTFAGTSFYRLPLLATTDAAVAAYVFFGRTSAVDSAIQGNTAPIHAYTP